MYIIHEFITLHELLHTHMQMQYHYTAVDQDTQQFSFSIFSSFLSQLSEKLLLARFHLRASPTHLNFPQTFLKPTAQWLEKAQPLKYV